MSSSFSRNGFEGKLLLIMTPAGVFSVYFRRGLFELLHILTQLGWVVICNHACPECVRLFVATNLCYKFPNLDPFYMGYKVKLLFGTLELPTDICIELFLLFLWRKQLVRLRAASISFGGLLSLAALMQLRDSELSSQTRGFHNNIEDEIIICLP